MHHVNVAGVSIPSIGFGTWQITGEACAQAVDHAVRLGYRHIDTAAIYENEREVGEGLRAAGVPRAELFVTTKIWRDSTREGDLQRAAEASLKRLGLDHVDLLLIHWPTPEVPLAETIGALNQVLHDGLTRAIGVSNFTAALVEEAHRLSPEPLATNQVEYHPFINQRPVMEAVRGKGMSLTAYSPLARGGVRDEPVLKRIAEARGKTPGQVALRWLVQHGDVIAIPKSASPERAAENLDVFDFVLDQGEMGEIYALARPDGRLIDPPWSPAWDEADFAPLPI